MSRAEEIISGIESSFQRQDFDSRDSMVRMNPSGHYVFEWSDSEVAIKGSFSDSDSIGFLVNSVEISKSIPADGDVAEYLTRVAGAIEKRVNYLMEPLKIVELDSTSNAVQMRSEKPELHQGQLSYYELILKAGKWFGHRNHVSLHRFTHPRADEAARETSPFPVTKKQFQKLLDDLCEVL